MLSIIEKLVAKYPKKLFQIGWVLNNDEFDAFLGIIVDGEYSGRSYDPDKLEELANKTGCTSESWDDVCITQVDQFIIEQSQVKKYKMKIVK